MPARNTINSGVRYSKLASDDDGYIDLQVRGKKAFNALKYANHCCSLSYLSFPGIN